MNVLRAELMPSYAAEENDELRRTALLWDRFVADRDPSVRDQLILQYGPLVKYVMKRIAVSLPSILEHQDLISSGTIGLIQAIERFDPSKGVKFETYAIPRVRGAMVDMLRSLDSVSRSARQKSRESQAAISKLIVSLEREPTHAEVALELGIPVPQYLRQLADISRVTVSLDAMGTDAGDYDYPSSFSVADQDLPEVASRLEHEDTVYELSSAIKELTERDQTILSLYYKEELTMRQVADVLGISESRVCQLHARALTRVRGSLERRAARAA